MSFNYPEKLEYTYYLYDFKNNCYHFRNKYVFMPDGKIFFSYYKKNRITPDHTDTFSVRPSEIIFLYFRINFLLRHANTNISLHNSSGSRIKLSYRLKNHEFAYHGLAFGIFGNKTPVSKIITTDLVMLKFIRKHCKKSLEYRSNEL